MGLFTKMFGTRSEREVKKLAPTVDKVMALEEPYKKLSDEEQEHKDALNEKLNRLGGG
jgi:preprotein translocase subunit SecA